MTSQRPSATSQPRVDWRLATMCAAVLTVLFTVQQYVNRTEATHATLLLIFTRQIIVWGVWLMLLTPIVAVARRYPVTGASRARWVLGQLPDRPQPSQRRPQA